MWRCTPLRCAQGHRNQRGFNARSLKILSEALERALARLDGVTAHNSRKLKEGRQLPLS